MARTKQTARRSGIKAPRAILATKAAHNEPTMPRRVLDRIIGDVEYKQGGDSVQMDGSSQDCVGLGISDNILKSGDESTIKITTTTPSNTSLAASNQET